MAFSITCPKCTAKLKTAAAIPIGRSVQCPKCKTSFAVSDENMEEVSDGKPMAAPAPAKPSRPAAAAAAAKPAAAPARSSRNDDENDDRASRRLAELNGTPKSRKRDDDDDRPRSRKRDEDEDDKPRSRKRDEDDDDRPRSRKRDEDDDDDDRPRSRKRDADDDDNRDRKRKRDDDDKPRSRLRGRNDDDDDDDDRPSKRGRDDDDDDDRPSRKKKKKKKQKKGSKMMLWVILGSVGLIGVIALVLFLIFSGGNYDKEMIAYLPEDTRSIRGEEYAAHLSNVTDKARTKLKESFDKRSDFKPLRDGGIAAEDVKRIIHGDGKEGDVTVVRLSKSIDIGKATSGASEANENGKKYFKMKEGFFLHFPSEKLVVQTHQEETLKKILKREEGKVVISEDLQSFAKKCAHGDNWHATIYEKEREEKEEGITVKIKGEGGYSSTSGIEHDHTMIMLCSSEEEAKKAAEEGEKKLEEVKKNIDKRIEEMSKFMTGLTDEDKKDIRDSIMSTSISRSGKYVEISTSGRRREKDEPTMTVPTFQPPNPGGGFQGGNPNPGFQGGNPNPGFQGGNPNPGFQGGNPNPGFQGGGPNIQGGGPNIQGGGPNFQGGGPGGMAPSGGFQGANPGGGFQGRPQKK
jgi:hypothetical protein